MTITTYRVTFAAEPSDNTFFSLASGGSEFVEIDTDGQEIIDIQTTVPAALEFDLDRCPDVVSYVVIGA